ncbi:MAG: UbiD family decarboxylase, partial [Planctomycetes bacterium]|nr:UbiD family decarboxylase [Planctomycetota bacterium]
MPYPDLQSYLQALDEYGYLKRVSAEVDPVLEIGAVADRMSKMPAADRNDPPSTDPVHGRQGGHALLFENVKGSDLPVAINVYGSYERMMMALGCANFEEMAQRIESLVKPQMPTTLIDKMKKLPELARLAGFAPKIVKKGLCHEVVHTDDADLTALPLIQCWPHDGRSGYGGKPADAEGGTATGTGRYITFGGIYTKDRDTGERNVGMYRVQLYDARTMAMHW